MTAIMELTWLIITVLIPHGVLGGLSSSCLSEALPPHMMEWQDTLAESAVMVEWGFGKVGLAMFYGYLFILLFSLVFFAF